MNGQTAIAFTRLIATAAAMVATSFGLAFDVNMVVTVCGVALSLVCLVWTWWKNNNVTEAAQEAQSVLDAIKDGDVIGLDELTAMPSETATDPDIPDQTPEADMGVE